MGEQGEQVLLLRKQDGYLWMVEEEEEKVGARGREPDVERVLPSSTLRESNLQTNRRVSWRATNLGKLLVQRLSGGRDHKVSSTVSVHLKDFE